MSAPSRGINQPAAYLDDLRKRDVKIGFGSLGKHGATGYPPEEMQRVQTDGRYVAHALSMHPRSNGSAQVSYALGGKYQSFSSRRGHHELRDRRTSRYAVAISRPGRRQDSLVVAKAESLQAWRVPCTVSVHGVMLLTLEVICPGPSRTATPRGSIPWSRFFLPRNFGRPVGSPRIGQTRSTFRFTRRSGVEAAGFFPAGQAGARRSRERGFREAAGARSGETGVDTRTPVPNAAARQKVLGQIRNLFKDDYAKAGTPDGRRALAKKLAKFAGEEKSDDVMRYVMANESLDLAVRVGDVAVGLQAGFRALYVLRGRFVGTVPRPWRN